MSATAPTTASEVVDAAYQAIGAGDLDAFIGLLADDCVLEEPAGHPTPGPWTGPEQIRAAFPRLAAALGLRGVNVDQIIGEGDRAFALVEVLLTAKSGAESSMTIVEVWDVRDGRVVRI